jgi:hypothetical protein
MRRVPVLMTAGGERQVDVLETGRDISRQAFFPQHRVFLGGLPKKTGY